MLVIPGGPPGRGAGRAAGFTLLEVMIAILVLAFGLLGFALLQTMNVRFTQSANHRTLATNLAYEMLDQVRVNRLAVAQYAGDYTASMVASDCDPVADPGGTNSTVTPASFRKQWQCRLGRGLGGGSRATVTYDSGAATGDAGRVTVAITWGDQRWNDADKDGSVSASESEQTFTTVSRL